MQHIHYSDWGRVSPYKPFNPKIQSTFVVPGQILYEKKNDPQCVHWTPDPSSPGQPRAGEQSLQIQETTGQMTGWAQPCGGDIPMGRGQEQGEMNLLYPLPWLVQTLLSAEKFPSGSVPRIPQQSNLVSGVTETLLLQQSILQAICRFNLIIYDNTSE